MEPFLTYLACPYSHPNPAVREERYRAANEAAVALIRAFKWNVFSPITHSHPMHELGLDGDWRFWEHIDMEYLSVSRRLVVLTMPGWHASVGVRAEHHHALKRRMEIRFMGRPETIVPAKDHPPTPDFVCWQETRFFFADTPPTQGALDGARFMQRWIHPTAFSYV